MTQLTVELDNGEMGQLLAAASARRIDPSHMTPQQLIQVLNAAAGTAKKSSWRRSARLRQKMAKAPSAAISFKIVKHTLALRAEGQQASAPAEAPAPVDAARTRRLAAIMSVNGMWKDDPEKPSDAVEYQREVRAEWP